LDGNPLAGQPQGGAGRSHSRSVSPGGALVTTSERSAEPPRGEALDLHEGICDPRASGGRPRWPEEFRIVNEATGELFAGMCRATNLCPYCQTRYVVETVEMLSLDAMENAPTLWIVLTAREHLTRKATHDHLRQLRKATRKRWPAIEWFVQVEFQRRGALHLNLLVKGVPVADRAELEELVVERWCARVDAEPVGQWVEPIDDGTAVVHYLSKMLAHGLKAEQRPPLGWKGHRTSQTRGYLVRPASVMREEARESLRRKRLLWKAMRKAEELGGLNATSDLVELVYEQLAAAASAATYAFVRVRPGTGFFLADFDSGRDGVGLAPRIDELPRPAVAAELGRLPST
jgi:hypothetical protein